MIEETFDLSFVLQIMPALIKAVPITLFTAAASMVAGCLAGLLLAIGKLSRKKPVSAVVSVLTDVIRGIPTIVLLYLAYFALPYFLKGFLHIDISAWPKLFFVILALSIELAALTSEMFRSAFVVLDKGQLEAAHSIGMTRNQRFFRIIVPQGLYIILPNLSSAVLALVQGTALAYTLGVLDVVGKANVLNTLANGMKTFEAYIDVSLIYWMISLLVIWGFGAAEKIMGRGQRTVANR